MVTGKKSVNDPDYFQPVVFYNQSIRVGFHSERITYPFYAQNVFLSEKDAVEFLRVFVKDLIKSGDIPSDAIMEDGNLDDRKIKTAIVPLIVTEMEIDNE